MLYDNKLLFSLLIALFYPLVVEAFNGAVEEISFKYEEYHTSSYALVVKEIKYKYNGSAYLLEKKENLHGTTEIPSYIEKTIVDSFVDTLAVRGKDSNTVFFTIQDVRDCISFINDCHHTDIPMILSSYDMDETFLIDNMPILYSKDPSYVKTIMDCFYSNTRKPFWGISITFIDGTIINIHPNSVYEDDSWCLGENNYIDYECVTRFLSQSHLSKLFIPLEKEYMMIHIIGMYKRILSKKINLAR